MDMDLYYEVHMKAVKEVMSLEVRFTEDGDFGARFSHGSILIIGRTYFERLQSTD
mgnify:CR=1 FL=1